jgi:phage shock protein A
MADDELEAAIDKAIDTMAPKQSSRDPQRIVENHIAHLDKVLTHLRKNEDDLVGQIGTLTSQLRQTRASIEAFGLAHDRLRP